MSRVVLLDTSILLAHYNEGSFASLLEETLKGSILRFSAVALYEVGRGAHNRTSKKIYRDLLNLARGTIITPTESDWQKATQVSERLLRAKKYDKIGVNFLENDILIALAARSIGGTLITLDSDFALLQRFISFQFSLLPFPHLP